MKSSPLARAKEFVTRSLVRLRCRQVAPDSGPSVSGRTDVHDGQNAGLIEDCVSLLVELEDLATKVDAAARPPLEHVRARLTEILERVGMNRIEDETVFGVARHRAWPPSCVAPGTPIVETLVPGLALGVRVLKRAKVRVK